MSAILKVLNKRFLTRSCNIKIPTTFYHNNANDDIIKGPHQHILHHVDKIEFPQIYSVFNYWLNIPQEKIKVIEDFVNSTNACYCLIDDICDDTPIRDSVPTTHTIYGKPVTIFSALYLLLQATKTSKQIHSDVPNIYTEATLELYKAQALIMHYRDILKCPTEEEYADISMNSTGSFYIMAIKMMQLFSENKTDFSKLLLKFGLYSHILDDYLDCKENKEDDTFAADIREGKFSYPIIHAINNHPEDKTLKYILSKRTNDRIIKEHVINSLERYGSFAYCKQQLRVVVNDIKEELKNFEDNPKMDEYLSYLYKLHENE